MPAIVDTHTHLAQTRDALVDQLQAQGVLRRRRGREPGPGHGRRAVPGARRDHSGRARASARQDAASRCRSPDAPRRRTGSPPKRRPEGRPGARRARKSTSSRSGSTTATAQYKKLTPELYGAIIDEAHKNGLRVTAHIFTLEDAKGLLRAGIDALRARRARQGHRRRVRGAGEAAPERRAGAEPARSRRGGGPQLAERHACRPTSLKKLQDGATESAGRAASVRHSGAQPGEAERGGRADRARHRRQTPLEPARRDGRHGGGRA